MTNVQTYIIKCEKSFIFFISLYIEYPTNIIEPIFFIKHMISGHSTNEKACTPTSATALNRLFERNILFGAIIR